MIGHVDLPIDAEPSAQRREACLEAKDTIIVLVTAAQDQPLLPLLPRPADGIIDHGIRWTYTLVRLIGSSQVRIDIMIIMKKERSGHDFAIVLGKGKPGMVRHLLKEVNEEPQGIEIPGLRSIAVHRVDVDLVKLADIIRLLSRKHPHVFAAGPVDVFPAGVRQ